MADFTDFNWQTGDYGEAAKFNSMVDNDRHLRLRTDFWTHHWGRSIDVSESARSYRLLLGGSVIADGTYASTPQDSIARVNLSISSIPTGLRTFQLQVGSTNIELFSARIYKHAQLTLASVWLTIVRFTVLSGEDPDPRVMVRDASLILHRAWQAW